MQITNISKAVQLLEVESLRPARESSARAAAVVRQPLRVQGYDKVTISPEALELASRAMQQQKEETGEELAAFLQEYEKEARLDEYLEQKKERFAEDGGAEVDALDSLIAALEDDAVVVSQGAMDQQAQQRKRILEAAMKQMTSVNALEDFQEMQAGALGAGLQVVQQAGAGRMRRYI